MEKTGIFIIINIIRLYHDIICGDFMIIDFNVPVYTYEKFIDDAIALSKEYSNILEYVTIGKSHDNRDIALLKLGKGKKHMFVCGGVHGRESINPIVLLRIIELYADMYSNYRQLKDEIISKMYNPTKNLISEYEKMIFESCIYELLQTYTILFVPLLNPDGYVISLEGYDSIRDEKLKSLCKDMNLPYHEWKYNARGIDINRNFPSKLWKAKFEGDYPASENETKALIKLFHDYKSLGFLDFHSRGKQIFYYRSQMPDSYNNKLYNIALRLKDVTYYELVAPEQEIEPDDSGGNTVHYYTEYIGKPALTIETVDEDASFPLDFTYRDITFNEIMPVIYEFACMII